MGHFGAGLVQGLGQGMADARDRKDKEMMRKAQVKLYDLQLKQAETAAAKQQGITDFLMGGQTPAPVPGGFDVAAPPSPQGSSLGFGAGEPAPAGPDEIITPLPDDGAIPGLDGRALDQGITSILADASLEKLISLFGVNDAIDIKEHLEPEPDPNQFMSQLIDMLGEEGAGKFKPSVSMNSEGKASLSLTPVAGTEDKILSMSDLSAFKMADGGTVRPMSIQELEDGLNSGAIVELGEPVGEAVATELATQDSIGQALEELRGVAEAEPELFGRLNSFTKKFANKFGGYIPEGLRSGLEESLGVSFEPDARAAEVYAKIAGIQNLVSSLRAGKTLTKDEIERIMNELPTEVDKAVDFEAKLSSFVDALERTMRTKLAVYKANGADVRNLELLLGKDRTAAFLADAEAAQGGSQAAGEVQPGEVREGKGGIKYEFLGGDPSDKANWKRL